MNILTDYHRERHYNIEIDNNHYNFTCYDKVYMSITSKGNKKFYSEHIIQIQHVERGIVCTEKITNCDLYSSFSLSIAETIDKNPNFFINPELTKKEIVRFVSRCNL